MPPKTAKVTEDAATAAIKVFLSVMKNCDSVKPAWDNVAKEIGIGYGKNAASKFKGIVEKHGYKFEGGRVTLPDGEADDEVDDNDASTTAVAPPALRKTKNSKALKPTNSKRKAAAVKDETADEAPAKPAKKLKKAAPKDDTVDEKPAKPATKTKKAAPKSNVVVKEETIKDEECIKGESDDQAGNGDDAKVNIDTKVAGVDDSDSSLLTPEEVADMV